MLKTLRLTNFTAFQDDQFKFAPGLNVIVGENGTGKTHILKAAYAITAVLAAPHKGPDSSGPNKEQLQFELAKKFLGVFRPDALGNLVRRTPEMSRAKVEFRFQHPSISVDLSFERQSREPELDKAPLSAISKLPVFLPTREVLSIYPGFVSLYETTHLPFEETWRDTCLLLSAPLLRGPIEAKIGQLLEPLESAMGGRIELDRGGRFYIAPESGEKLEIHLVAEGLRKLATVARLIATGSLLENGSLFWDEPESNLNPRLIKAVARTILQISASGIQVFVATHSLFLLRELHILHRTSFATLNVRYFGLDQDKASNRVVVHQADTMDEIGAIAALDEDLAQSDRYIDVETGAAAPSN